MRKKKGIAPKKNRTLKKGTLQKSSSKKTIRSKKQPVVQYVVNASPPKQILLTGTEHGYRSAESPRFPVRNLRVLTVIDQFNVGGTETHVLASIRELLRRGAHVVVAGKKGEMRDAFAALGCPIYEINFVTENFIRNVNDEDKIIAQLKQIMNIEGINIVHSHQVPSGYLVAEAANQLRIPLVFTLHGLYQSHEVDLFKKYNAMICVSPTIKKQIPVKNIPNYLIPNGIDTIQYDYRSLAEQELREELGIQENAPIFMYAGRLSWEKAEICKDTIEACKQLKKEEYPDLHLLIAGGGHDSENIHELVEEAHKESGEIFIHLLGNSMNMSSYYSLSDCVIGTGRTAIEALACSRPVIAIGTKGFFGLVKPDNYESAWESWFGDHLASEKWTVDKLKSCLQEVMKTPGHLKFERGWVGRNLIKEQFNISRTTDKLLNVYVNMIEERYQMCG